MPRPGGAASPASRLVTLPRESPWDAGRNLAAPRAQRPKSRGVARPYNPTAPQLRRDLGAGRPGPIRSERACTYTYVHMRAGKKARRPRRRADKSLILIALSPAGLRPRNSGPYNRRLVSSPRPAGGGPPRGRPRRRLCSRTLGPAAITAKFRPRGDSIAAAVSLANKTPARTAGAAIPGKN